MPWIPAAVQAAISIYQAIKGAKEANKAKKKEEVGYGYTTSALDQLQGMSGKYQPQVNKYLDQSNQGFTGALGFWGPLLSASKDSATSVLAPDINRISQQFDQILQATKGERTGAGASIYAAAPYAQQAQVQSLFSTLRPQAAKEMANIGSQTGQLGFQGLYAMLNALGQMQEGGLGLMGKGMAGSQYQSGKMQELGKGVAPILDQLGQWFQNRGNSGSGNTTPWP